MPAISRRAAAGESPCGRQAAAGDLPERRGAEGGEDDRAGGRVVGDVEHLSHEGRHDRREEAEDREAGEPARRRRDEDRSHRPRHAEAGRPDPQRPRPRPLDRLGHQPDPGGGGDQQAEIDDEDERERIGGVLREQAGEERAETEAADVDDGGDQGGSLGLPLGGQIDQGRGGRAREDPGREPGEDAAGEEQRQARRRAGRRRRSPPRAPSPGIRARRRPIESERLPKSSSAAITPAA